MTGLVEKEYSKAIFEISEEEGKSEAILNELTVLSEIFSENEELVKLLSSPTLSADEKHGIISDIFKDRLSETTFNFLNVIADHGRINRITGIIECYKSLYNEKNGILEVTAITMEPMSDSIRKKLIDKLTAISSKKINLVEKTDRKILGGIVLNYGNTQLDASLKSRLDAMRSKIDSVIA